MARQRWLTTAGMLGLLVAARVGWADEAAAVKAIQELGGRVEVDDAAPRQARCGSELFRHQGDGSGAEGTEGIQDFADAAAARHEGDGRGDQGTQYGTAHAADLFRCQMRPLAVRRAVRRTRGQPFPCSTTNSLLLTNSGREEMQIAQRRQSVIGRWRVAVPCTHGTVSRQRSIPMCCTGDPSEYSVNGYTMLAVRRAMSTWHGHPDPSVPFRVARR